MALTTTVRGDAGVCNISEEKREDIGVFAVPPPTVSHLESFKANTFSFVCNMSKMTHVLSMPLPGPRLCS